jgi:hypothetical protein
MPVRFKSYFKLHFALRVQSISPVSTDTCIPGFCRLAISDIDLLNFLVHWALLFTSEVLGISSEVIASYKPLTPYTVIVLFNEFVKDRVKSTTSPIFHKLIIFLFK